MKHVARGVIESHTHVDSSTGFVFNDVDFINKPNKERKRKKEMKALVNQEIEDKKMNKVQPKPLAKKIERVQDIDLDDEDWETISDPNNVENKPNSRAIGNSISTNLIEENEPPMIAKSAIDLKAIKMKDDRSLPPIIGKAIGLPELNEWLGLLDTPQKKERIMMYLYRTFPVCNRQLIDPDNPLNIDVLKGEPIILADFISMHGGGKYKLIVNDVERNRISKTSNGTIYTVHFDVSFTEHIPNIRWEELDIQDRRNKGFITWCQGKGILDGQGRYIGDSSNPVANANAQVQPRSISGASTRDGDIANKLLDHMLKQTQDGSQNKRQGVEESATTQAIRIVADTSAKQMEVLVNSIKGQNNDKDTLSGIASILTPLLASRVDPNALSMKDLMVMMQAQSDSQMKMMLMIMEANKPKDTGSSKISELRDLMGLAKDLMGAGKGTESLTDRALNIVEENAGPLLGVISNMMSMGKNPNVVQPTANTQDFVTQPISQSTQQPIIPIMQQPLQTVGVGGGNEDMHLDPEVLQLKQAVKNSGGMIINSLAQNVSGDVFADSLITMFSRPTYMMIAKCGRDKLLLAMRSIPEFWQASAGTYGEPTIVKFVEDFMNHDAIVAAEQTGEEPDLSESNGKVIDIDNPNTATQDKLAAMNRS